MEAVWRYLVENPILLIVAVLVVAYVFSRIAAPGAGQVREEDKVPHYKRFERRDTEFGDRRKEDAEMPQTQDQRKDGRRLGDWFRRKR